MKDITSTLGTGSVDYKIWLRLYPDVLRATYSQGRDKERPDAQRQAEAECRAAHA